MSTTPHDSFFKDVFGPGKGHLASLIPLLDTSLASRIDISSIKYIPGESIDEDLSHSTRTDLTASFLLSRAKVGGGEARIAFIFEHKSFRPQHIHISLLSLVSALLSRDLREGGSPRPVIPVLLYHGRTPWKGQRRFSSALKISPELVPLLPDFELTIIDLSRFSDETLRERIVHPEPLVSLTVMKHIFEPPSSVLGHLVRMIKTLSPPRDIMKRIVNTTLHYISHVNKTQKPKEIRTLFTTFLAEEKMPTVLDLLKEEGIQEGIEKGIEKGVRIGIEKGQDKAITGLLQHSPLSPQQIASFLDVDLSRVLKLADSLPHGPHGETPKE